MTLNWNLRSCIKRMLSKFHSLIGLLVLMLPLGVQAGLLQVNNAVLQMPLPGQTMGVGYFDIKNTGSEAVQLIEVSHSDWDIEMHESVMKDGRMRMQLTESVEVPAGSSVEFYQGGLHLMIMGWIPDDSTTTEVHFTMSDGSRISVPFSITRW